MRELTVQEDYYLILLRLSWHKLTKRQKRKIRRADVTAYSVLEGLAEGPLEPKRVTQPIVDDDEDLVWDTDEVDHILFGKPFRPKTPTPEPENFSKSEDHMAEETISTHTPPTYYRVDYLCNPEASRAYQNWEEIPSALFMPSRFTDEAAAALEAETYANTHYVTTRVVKVQA